MEKIRDNGYKSRRDVEAVSAVVGFLGQMTAHPVMAEALPIVERPDAAQLGYTMMAGYDSEGRYMVPDAGC